MTAPEDCEPHIARLALVLVKYRITGEHELADALLDALDPADIRQLLVEQTGNTVRVFSDAIGDKMAALARRFGRPVDEVMADHISALILNLAVTEADEG